MIDQELKKKIVNTISRYELKCDKLQVQINSLKNVINQLIITPMGVNYEMDEHIIQFQKQLDEEFDPIALEDKVNFLADLIIKLQKKKLENTRMTTRLLKQCSESIGRLANKSQDKRAVSKLQKMLETDVESHTILVNFNDVLSQCVSSVITKIDEFQTSKGNADQDDEPNVISLNVNESLHQLLNHLSIPKDLDTKREHIKSILDKQLNGENLSKVIDGLTELVVDAFNVEQNRFKGFLQQLTNQLHDVDIYLKSSSDSRKQASAESLHLETGIQDNINQIKSHLDSSNSIEELTYKVTQNLDSIGSRIKEYRDNEKMREKALESEVQKLTERLNDSEQSAEEIKNLLSFQKYKINHDSLTGLPNRDSYDEHILDAFQRWKRDSKDLSLAVCDIDRFKRINDTFGHLAGDKVLKKVAQLLKESIRSVDFIARVGGEEFVIIFEQSSSKGAHSILEKLRKLIQDCQFYYRDNKVDVTVSFGLTTAKDGDNIESLFMRADNAMYNAKNAGRNRVEIL